MRLVNFYCYLIERFFYEFENFVALIVLIASTTYCEAREYYGCHKGYFWARAPVLQLHLIGATRCYTTKGKTQDRNYIQCKNSLECDADWSCAGPCTP